MGHAATRVTFAKQARCGLHLVRLVTLFLDPGGHLNIKQVLVDGFRWDGQRVAVPHHCKLGRKDIGLSGEDRADLKLTALQRLPPEQPDYRVDGLALVREVWLELELHTINSSLGAKRSNLDDSCLWLRDCRITAFLAKTRWGFLAKTFIPYGSATRRATSSRDWCW